MQIVYQLIGSSTIAAYSFFITYAILFIINKIPGLHLRPDELEEFAGADFYTSPMPQ
jgi:ammonium transporter, Amt family